MISTAAAHGINWTEWALYSFSSATANCIFDASWNPSANQFPLTSYGEPVRDAM